MASRWTFLSRESSLVRKQSLYRALLCATEGVGCACSRPRCCCSSTLCARGPALCPSSEQPTSTYKRSGPAACLVPVSKAHWPMGREHKHCRWPHLSARLPVDPQPSVLLMKGSAFSDFEQKGGCRLVFASRGSFPAWRLAGKEGSSHHGCLVGFKDHKTWVIRKSQKENGLCLHTSLYRSKSLVQALNASTVALISPGAIKVPLTGTLELFGVNTGPQLSGPHH